jgi:hypothetical protein
MVFRNVDADVYNAIFSAGDQPVYSVLPIDAARFARLVDSIPQRGSNLSLKESATAKSGMEVMPGQMASIMMQLVHAMGGRAAGNTPFHSEVPIQYAQKHELPPQYQPEKPPPASICDEGDASDVRSKIAAAQSQIVAKSFLAPSPGASVSTAPGGLVYTKRLSVTEATDTILAELGGMTGGSKGPRVRKDAAAVATGPLAATCEKTNKNKKPKKALLVHSEAILPPVKKKGKKHLDGKTGSATTPTKKQAKVAGGDYSGKKKMKSPIVSDEVRRSQVRCRSTDGTSFSIKYSCKASRCKAMKQAKDWLATQA